MTISKNHDDNLDGVVQTKSVQGGLVRVPIPLTAISQTAGTSTIASTNQSVANPDSSGSAWTLTAAGGQGNYVWMEFQFWGRNFGIRYDRSNSATRAPFACVVDGEVFKVDYSQSQDYLGNVSGGSDRESLQMLVQDMLTDGPHNCRINLASDAYGGTTRTAVIYGMIVDASKGYKDFLPKAFLATAGVAVPTTATAFGSVQSAMSQLSFYNSSATVSHTVTLLFGTNVMQQIVIPALGYAEKVFTVPTASGGWNWKVDAGADVLGSVYAGKVTS